jgi:small-conductance mechanosensitive channel
MEVALIRIDGLQMLLDVRQLITIAIGVAPATVFAYFGYTILMFVLRRAVARTRTQVDDLLVRRLCRPAFWLLVVFGLAAEQPLLRLTDELDAIWHQVVALALPALVGWIAIAFLGAFNDIVLIRNDIAIENNLSARRRRTRAAILYRIAVFIVLLITACLMLMSIPAVRTIGVTLIASAGLIGLAVGAAAQPALKNLVAGIQMVFTEPIRIDDVVIMDGEWGRIEEIWLTFVVVKIWDERRLVVPVSKFLENSFQNWTRETSQLLGTVFFHVDPTTDVPRIREKLKEVVSTNPRWDKRLAILQVTETYPDRLELRALVSAANADKAFDLRCDIREAITTFIANDMPDAIPRNRRLQTVVQE